MKRTFILIALAFLLLPGGFALAGDIWQIGTPDGDLGNPILGAAEYPANGNNTNAFNGYFTTTFEYTVKGPKDDMPQMPGYIGSVNVCDIPTVGDTRACTLTTADLYIRFLLECPVESAVLVYDRYGSESDNIYVDGLKIDTINPTNADGNFDQYSWNLGTLAAGVHTVRIEYAGAGLANGHYIDYIKLTGTQNCSTNMIVNIKPYSWPNGLNTCSQGGTPVIIWGSEFLDVYRINLDSLTLGDKGLKVVGKGNKDLFEIGDFGQPTDDPDCVGVNGCDAIDPTWDGYDDLNAKFDTYQLATFSDGTDSWATVCFDYDVDGNGTLANFCTDQEVFLTKECVAPTE